MMERVKIPRQLPRRVVKKRKEKKRKEKIRSRILAVFVFNTY